MNSFLIIAIALIGCSAAQLLTNGSETRCPRNERFMSCGTACEPSCETPNPQMCTKQCIVNVCQCLQGFVRDPATNTCVRRTRCSGSSSTTAPHRCAANETFTECGTACEPSCTSPEPRMCTMQCILNVCQCTQGFVRGPGGCVSRRDC
ncbi:unnamed protein product [Caenorhabditis sp. 36 PRJEB53466]|nr:unnamed protein product [Caenorhabditis sp. 36 PRJEB53466]